MGNEQTKKGKKILEEKKKAVANLNAKKEKMDRIHSTVREDIGMNVSNPVNDGGENFKHSQTLNYEKNYNNINTHNLNPANHAASKNKSVNLPNGAHSEAYQDAASKFNLDQMNMNKNKFNISDNNIARKQNTADDNNNFLNVINNNNNYINKNSIPSNSVYVPNNVNNNIANNFNHNINEKYNANNPNNTRYEDINQPIENNHFTKNKTTFSGFGNYLNNMLGSGRDKQDKLKKDLETMDKLVEKYKILYLDSYYFKKDKNYKEAIESNLKGQEYVAKLQAILNEKKEKEFNKYINIANNLQNQFCILFQEIEQELNQTGQSVDNLISKSQIKHSMENKNNANSNMQEQDCRKNYSFVTNQANVNIHSDQPSKRVSSVGNDLLERIKSEILDSNPHIKFDEVVGLDRVKQALKEIIIIPSLRPDLFTGLRTPAKGLLLFGPPGTGKTLIAKAVATECNSTFFNISASSLTSKYVGESEKLVRALFEVAHYPENQPAIIFIDEIESILSKRSENENEASKRLKTEFLIQFDGVATNSTDRVLVIGATNRPQDLDAAVLRRLPKKIYVGPMDFEGRAYFIFEILKNTKTENNLTKNDYKEIASWTENYSNSDLKELCRQACIEPIRELKEGQLKTINKLRPITVKDFQIAVKAVRGTLTQQMLQEYQDWNRENGAIN